MNYLLYSSNEMFSATELVRKSKKIFDKLVKKEIDKAIILRDGKPSFVMLDFNFYEDIMSEYLMLKQNLNPTNGSTIENNDETKEFLDKKIIDVEVKKFDEELQEIEDKFEENYIDDDLKALEEFEIDKKPNDSILNEFLDLKEEAEKEDYVKKEEETKEANLNNIDEVKNEKDATSLNIDNKFDKQKEVFIEDELSEEEKLKLLKKEEEELKKTLEALEKLNISSPHEKKTKEVILEKNIN